MNFYAAYMNVIPIQYVFHITQIASVSYKFTTEIQMGIISICVTVMSPVHNFLR